ncbi:MAG: ABC transporter permease [Pseudobdellovibrionaceae bacterium]
MQPHFSAVDSEIHFSKDQPAVDNGASEIIIGVDLARSLGVFEGDYVTLVPPESLLLSQGEVPRFEKVRIQKILTTNLADLDAQMIFYNRQTSLLTLQKSMALQRGLEVWLPEPEKAERYAQELRAFSDVTVETWQDRNAALFQALRLEKTTMGLFLGLASAIAGSSIITVMSLLISQKRKDIAMLVALGLSQKRILHIFTAVGSLLSGVGLFLGLFFGTGLGLYLQYFPPQILPDIYYDSKIPSQVTWFTLLVVAGSGLLVSFLGSYFPAKEASQSAAEPSRTLQGR